MVNPNRMGLLDAIIGIRVDPDKVLEIAQSLAQLGKIRYIAVCTGPYDIVASSYFESQSDLFDFITCEAGKIPGVQRCETIQIIRALKRNYVSLY